jgi:hypothetical protein
VSEKILRQVKLHRPVEGGVAEDVWWIDNAVAKVGKRVLDEAGVTWVVVEIYGARAFSDIDKVVGVQKVFAKKLDKH